MFTNSINTAIIILFSFWSLTDTAPSGENVKDLYKHVFAEYDKRIRPVKDQGLTINVDMIFNIAAVTEFDEKAQKVAITGSFNITWIDEYLAWDTLSFGNISHLYVNNKDIWLPGITLINPFDNPKFLANSETRLIIQNDGRVTWYPGDIFVVSCGIKIKYYPFDKQNCALHFAIWDMLKEVVSLTLSQETIDRTYLQENVEWEIINTTVETFIVSGNSLVSFSLKLKRRSAYIIITTIVPLVFLGFLNVCVFLIPLTSGEKISFTVTMHLSYGVFIGAIRSELPHDSTDMSYFTMYIMLLLLLSVVIVMVTVLQVRLYIEMGDSHLPSYFMMLFSSCCRHQKTDISEQYSIDSNTYKDIETNENGHILLKDCLPKLDIPLFCLFISIFCVLTISFCVIPSYYNI